ncbi:MAG: cysteine desulfurase family protein [Candidatus Eisenbacteria bacterium]
MPEPRRVYLDHNATTPVRPEVAEVMTEAFRRWWGNPSSPYRSGREARAKLGEARETVAGLLGAESEGVVFTGSGTEADNLAILGIAAPAGAGSVVISEVEHPAVDAPAALLAARGFEVTRIPVGPLGAVDPGAFSRALRERTRIVSLIHGQNETGVLQPVREVGALCRERHIPFHTDAAQTAGKFPLDLREDPIDLVTVVGHKIYGPKGAGALVMGRGLPPLGPVTVGGGQEGGRRPGTESVPLALGLATALRLAVQERDEEQPRLRRIRDRFEKRLVELLDGVTVVGAGRERIPGTSYVLLAGVSGGAVSEELDRRGLEISTGSACHSGSPEPSATLLAMGIPREAALGGIRIGFGKSNAEADGDLLADTLAEVVPGLRRKG